MLKRASLFAAVVLTAAACSSSDFQGTNARVDKSAAATNKNTGNATSGPTSNGTGTSGPTSGPTGGDTAGITEGGTGRSTHNADGSTVGATGNGTANGTGNGTPGTDIGELGNTPNLGEESGERVAGPTGPDITSDDLINRVVSKTDFIFDGRLLLCLNWKTGMLRSQKMFEDYFASNVTFTVTSARGPSKAITLVGESSVQLPGKWGAAVCGATPVMPVATPTGTKHRDNPPLIQIQQNGTEACLSLDDALDGRPGAVKVVGIDFGVRGC